MDSKDSCICPQLYEFYQKEFLCDVILIAKEDGTRIATHRIVISAASEYFERMFGTSMKEKDMKEISLGNVSGTILKNLIDYCYTGEYHIDAENINGVLSATTMFRFEKLVARCAEFLNSNVNNESCLNIWTTAKLFGLHEVSSTAWIYICDNFFNVAETDAFLQLSSEQLIEISNSDEIVVESEENLFTSIMKWVEFDAEKRRHEFENLISVIRMSEISYAFLMEHVLKVLIAIGSKDYFVELCEYVAKSKGKHDESKPRNRENYIYAICSPSEKGEVKIQRYNKSLNSWEIAYTFNQKLLYFDVICIRKEIFLIGGEENDSAKNNVRCLSLNYPNADLKEMKPMKNKRRSSASAKLFGYLYITGGIESIESMECIDSVERLNLKTMEWSEVPSMQQKRSRHSAAVLSDKLFVTGGLGDRILDNVEFYDPQTNSWSTVSSMNVPRYGHRCVVVNNFLYAIGGHQRNTICLKSIEKYDFVADKWTMIEMELSKPVAYFGAFVSQNWIFIGGGIDTYGCGSTNFEKMNMKTGEQLVLTSLIERGACSFTFSGLTCPFLT